MNVPKPEDLTPYEPPIWQREFMLLVLEQSRRRRENVGDPDKDLEEFFDVMFKTGYAIVPRGLIDTMANYVTEQRRVYALQRRTP